MYSIQCIMLIASRIVLVIFLNLLRRTPLNLDLNFRGYSSMMFFLLFFFGKVGCIRVTGCRFVQFADSYTWSFQACTSFTMSIKKKLITRAIKQATVSTIFSARARVACRFQSMQTIIFNYQCDSVSSTAVKFRNHIAAFQ